MRISGSGMASHGLRAIKERRRPYEAEGAIRCFHDMLLAVAKGMVTPEQVKDFFWQHDLDKAKFFGGVLKFEEEKKDSTQEGK